jgi:hypothetical protein
VPQTHPLRAIKRLADETLAKLSPVFDAMYAEGGRPSIPPERLLKSMLLIARTHGRRTLPNRGPRSDAIRPECRAIEFGTV